MRAGLAVPIHPSSRLASRLARLAWGLAGLAAAACAGCEDRGKASAQKATADVAFLTALVESDVGEVERGMPEGAKRLAPLFAKGDPHDDVPSVRAALLKTRRDVADLNISKSTFFALADAKGVAIRNNLEQDVMAGQSLVAPFPELAKAQGGAYVTTTGAFPGTSTPAAPDRDWIAAAPVKADDGRVVGVFVTGWTYRRFALHLQESLKHELAERLRKEHDTGKLPILYVAVFDRTGVYAAPQTPAVNEKALADASLVDKTASGVAQAPLSITDRDFGYAAARAPKLGPEIGVVVLRSEL